MRIFADSMRIFEGIKNVKDFVLQLILYQEKLNTRRNEFPLRKMKEGLDLPSVAPKGKPRFEDRSS